MTDAFSDPDTTDVLTYTATGLPTGLTLDPVTGIISGTIDPSASQNGNTGIPTDGVYTVEVTATDPSGATITDTFTYTVENLPPVAEDDELVADEDTVLSGDVFADNGNGVDGDTAPDSDPIVVSQVGGNAADVGQLVAGTNGGTFTINVDGTYEFDPGTDFNGLAVGQQASTTIEYQISDGNGGFDTALITVVVGGLNDAPVIIDPLNPPIDPANPEAVANPNTIIPVQTADDGEEFTATNPLVDVSDYIQDPDQTDVPTYSTTDPLPAGLTLNPDGTITGIVDPSASQGGPNADGIYPVTVTVDDGNGGTVDVPLTLDVSNLDPTAVEDASAGDEDSQQSGNVLTDAVTGDGDTAPDSDPVTVTDVDGTPVVPGTPAILNLTYGTLTLADDGSWTFAPNGTANTLAEGENVTETVTYTIDDGQGGTDTADLVITITGVNDPVQVVDPSNPATDPADPSYDPTNPAVIADPDNLIADVSATDGEVIATIPAGDYFGDAEGDTLTFSATDLPAGLSIDPATGDITGNIDNSASQNGNTAPGVYDVVITASDPQGNVATTTVTYTITNPPVIAQDDVITTSEDASASGDVFADNGNGVDSDTAPDSDDIIVSLVDGLPANVGQPTLGTAGGEFNINADGTFTFEPGNDFQNLAAGDTATTTITYQITDNEGSVSEATVTVTVEGVNDAPIPVDPTQPVLVNPTDPSAPPSDPDDPHEAPLDPLNYIPVQNAVDGQPDLPPLDLTAYFGDPDAGDDLIITLDPFDLPVGLTYDVATGIISGTPAPFASQGGDPLNPGTYVIPVTATDPSGATFTTNVTYVVENLAPIATDDVLTASEDAIVVSNVLDGSAGGVDGDTSPDDDAVYVSAVNGLPANIGQPVTGSDGGEFTVLADGTVTFDPAGQFESLAPGETATTSITYTITDAQGGTDQATITVTIEGAADAPLVSNPGLDQTNDDGETITPVDVSGQFTSPAGEPLTFTASGLPEGLTIDPVTGIISGTLPIDASLSGPYPVVITATTPSGLSSTTPLIWEVLNPAPEAIDDQVTTGVDQPVTINPLGNDVDPDGDALTVTVVTQPANGTASLQPDGTISYVPNAGFTGIDTITYTVTDGQGGEDTATITIEVTDTPPTGFPVPTPLDAQTGADGEEIIPIDVSNNFIDPDGDGEPLIFTATDLPPGLTIDPDTGIISGTIDPSASQVGPYDVTITATDPDGNQVSETFPFEVTNPAPIAAADQTTTAPNTPVLINVLGNDIDPDGDDLSVVEFTEPSNGVVTINPDGTVTYTPNAGFTGIDVFAYIVTDGDGGFSTGTVTVNVTDTPPAGVPTSTDIPPQTAEDGQDVGGVDITPFFSSPNNEPLTYTAIGLPEGLTLDPDTGIITGILPSDASVEGPYEIVITATDPDGNTVSEATTLTATNPVPMAQDDRTETSPETPVVISVLTNDSDPDGDDLTIIGTTTPANGTVAVNPDGTVTYTPNTGFMGEDSFTYTLSDGEGGETTATVTVNVTNEPVGPVPAPVLPVQTVTDGQDVTPLDTSAAFGDLEGDTLSFTATGLPAGLEIDPNTGEISGMVDPDASTLGPDPQNPGVYQITVTADDGVGGTAQVTLTYVVTNVPPVAVDDAFSGSEDSIQTGNVLNDAATGDADGNPDSDPLVVTQIEGQPVVVGTPTVVELTNGTLEMNDDGSWSFTPNGNVNALDVGETLIETVTYMISDGQGGADEAELVITIEGVNDAVVLVDPNNPATHPTDPTYNPVNPNTPADPSALVAPLSATDGLPFAEFDATPFFADAEGDTITYTATGLPEGLIIDPATGVISGTPANDASVDGPYNVVIIGTDPQGNTAELPIVINVANQPPVLDLEVPNYTVYPGQPLQVPVENYFSDPDHDTLTFTAEGLPAGFTIDPATGVISGDADPETVTGGPNGDGIFVVIVTVDDGQGGTITDTFEIKVLPQPFTAPSAPKTPVDQLPPVGIASFEGAGLPITNLVSELGNLGPNIGFDNLRYPIDGLIKQYGDLAPDTALEGPHYIDALSRYIKQMTANDRDDAQVFGSHGDGTHPYLGDDAFVSVALGTDTVVFRSMVWRGEVYLEMLDSSSAFRVTGPDGSALPLWINQRGPNLLLVDRPANVEAIAIEIQVTQADGSVKIVLMDIDLLTGQLDAQTAPSGETAFNGNFSQRISALIDEPLQQQAALFAALKNQTL